MVQVQKFRNVNLDYNMNFDGFVNILVGSYVLRISTALLELWIRVVTIFFVPSLQFSRLVGRQQRGQRDISRDLSRKSVYTQITQIKVVIYIQVQWVGTIQEILSSVLLLSDWYVALPLKLRAHLLLGHQFNQQNVDQVGTCFSGFLHAYCLGSMTGKFIDSYLNNIKRLISSASGLSATFDADCTVCTTLSRVRKLVQ